MFILHSYHNRGSHDPCSFKNCLDKSSSAVYRGGLKLILLVSCASFLFNLLYDIAEFAFSFNYAPFGFEYEYVCGASALRGKLNYINPEKVAQIVQVSPSCIESAPHFITFRSRLYISAGKTYSLHLSPRSSTKMYLDGQPQELSPNNGFYENVYFDEGWHDVIIHCFLEKQEWGQSKIRFVLMDGSVPAVPFYGYVLPGCRRSVLLGRTVDLIARYRNFGYFLGFSVLLVYLFIGLRHVSWRVPINPIAHKPSVLFTLLESLGCGLSLLLILVFINGYFALQLGTVTLLVLSISLFSIQYGFSLKRTSHKWTISAEAIVIVILSTVWCLLYIWQKSGSLFPLNPIGKGDVLAHLSMIDYISESGHFMQGGWGPIYPQALHGLFALVSDICGLASRQMITLLLMAFMILLPVILYYFSKFFVPTLSIGPFFLVLVISNAEFIQYSLFELYSFPAVFAVELFVLSLFYLINEHYLSSSLLFTAALLSYPYYAFVFGLISFLFLIRNLLKSMVKPYLMIIWSWLYFVLPGLYLFLYLVTFLKTGYAQQEQGFDPAIKLVPFDFLTNTNALLIIVGLYCSVRYKLSKAIHFLALTVMLGFLGYYLPYLFFSVQTAYYFMKNVHYLILFGIVFELIAVMMFIDKIDCRRNIRIIVDILILLCSLCYYWFVQ